MKKLIQLYEDSQLIGKTIKNSFEADENFFLSFTDDTFVTFYSYESTESVYISDDAMSQEPTMYNYNTLYNLGIISDSEKEAQKEEELRYIKDKQYRNETYEIEQLKRLQLKYPNIK